LGESLSGLPGGLSSPDVAERVMAARAVRALPKEAAPDISELVPLLKDDWYEVGRHIRAALIAIGKPAAPHLRGALKNSHKFSRLHALIALEELGAGAGVLEEELRPLLADEMGSVRLWACAVAAHLDVPSVELTHDLAALLDDPRAAESAETALRRLFGRPNQKAHEAAEAVLGPLADKAKGKRLDLFLELLDGASVKLVLTGIPDSERPADLAKFPHDTMPQTWLFAGPIPGGDLDRDHLEGIGGRTRVTVRDGLAFTVDGAEFVFRPLPATALWVNALTGLGDRPALELTGIHGAQNSIGYYASFVDNDAPRLVRLRVGSGGCRPGARVFLDGHAVYERRPMRLGVGRHRLLVVVGLGEYKSHAKIWMAPRLADDTAAIEALQRSRDEAARHSR
jgi:hypothetical protein